MWTGLLWLRIGSSRVLVNLWVPQKKGNYMISFAAIRSTNAFKMWSILVTVIITQACDDSAV